MKQGDDDGDGGVGEVLMDKIKRKKKKKEKVTMKFALSGRHIGTLVHYMTDTKANYVW